MVTADIPLRLVVAPDTHGRFHADPRPSIAGQPLAVLPGDRLGVIRNGGQVAEVRSPFSGQVGQWLVWDGQQVLPGQPLCTLEPA